MTEFILFTKGTDGDLVPFLEIGRLLQRRGRKVTLLSHCYYAGIAEKLGMDFAALDTAEEYESFIRDGQWLNKPQGIPLFFRKHHLPKIIPEYRLIQSRCRAGRTVLVCRHAATTADLMMAEKQEILLARLFTAVSQVDTLPMMAMLYHELFADELNRIRGKIGLGPRTDWRGWLELPALNLGNWPHWFAETNAVSQLKAVGFLCSDSAEGGVIPEAADRLIEQGAPTILITGSTGVFLGAEFYAAAVDGCRLLSLSRPRCRVLAVTRHRELLPARLPDNVAWFASLPFTDVVPKVDVIIHHGGAGTIARALASGIPQLIMPVGADRPDNARRLERLGTAAVLMPSDLQAPKIVEALDRLLTAPQVQMKCRSWARLMRAQDAAARACDELEALAAAFPSTDRRLHR